VADINQLPFLRATNIPSTDAQAFRLCFGFSRQIGLLYHSLSYDRFSPANRVP